MNREKHLFNGVKVFIKQNSIVLTSTFMPAPRPCRKLYVREHTYEVPAQWILSSTEYFLHHKVCTTCFSGNQRRDNYTIFLLPKSKFLLVHLASNSFATSSKKKRKKKKMSVCSNGLDLAWPLIFLKGFVMCFTYEVSPYLLPCLN